MKKHSTYKLAACHSRSTPVTDERRTPKAFFDYIERTVKVKFTIDIAANRKNTLCKKYYSQKDNALTKDWKGVAWCNPPYSLSAEFIKQAAIVASVGRGSTFLLVASRTDQEWWKMTRTAYARLWIRGRIKFVGSDNSAPFPSVIIVFKNGYQGPPKDIYLSPTSEERGGKGRKKNDI